VSSLEPAACKDRNVRRTTSLRFALSLPFPGRGERRGVRGAATQDPDLLELPRQNLGPHRPMMDSPRAAGGVDQEHGRHGQDAPGIGQARPRRSVHLQNLQPAVVFLTEPVERRFLDRLARAARGKYRIAGRPVWNLLPRPFGPAAQPPRHPPGDRGWPARGRHQDALDHPTQCPVSVILEQLFCQVFRPQETTRPDSWSSCIPRLTSLQPGARDGPLFEVQTPSSSNF
jgi:hypothetical protein